MTRCLNHRLLLLQKKLLTPKFISVVLGMRSTAATPEAYLADAPASQQQFVMQLRDTIEAHLPDGFEEVMSYGMISYVVPHHLYPAGYHCDPKQPLLFAGLAYQKNSINFYHMGIYTDLKLLAWFQHERPKYSSRKLDMGKSCIRFRKYEEIPYALIGELMKKMSVQTWIKLYEKKLKR